MSLEQVEYFVEAIVAIQTAQVIEQFGRGLWSCRVAEHLLIVYHDYRPRPLRAVDADEPPLSKAAQS